MDLTDFNSSRPSQVMFTVTTVSVTATEMVLHIHENSCMVLIPLGIEITRLRLRLSRLNEHKFNHNFKNCVNPLCTCSLEIESTSYFFLHCVHYNSICSVLLNELNSLDWNILKLSNTTLTNLIHCSCSQFNIKQNTFILNAVIKYILASVQFNGSLF